MSVKDAVKAGQRVTVIGKANVSKVRDIIKSDGRYTIRDNAKAVVSYFTWKRILKVRKVSDRWLPHMLKDD